MAFSAEMIRDLKNRMDAALNGGHLDAWQTKFLTNMRAQIGRHGTKTRLSDKQASKLYEIIGHEGPWGQVVPLRPQGAARQRPPWRRRKKSSFLAREGRRFVSRFVRKFAIAAALIGAIAVFGVIQSQQFSTNSDQYIARPITNGQFSVTDGDTIRVNGSAKGTRLIGFNTPETYQPRCDRELELGKRATARLKELVAMSDLSLEMRPCACETGTQGTKDCNFGRSCGVLRADGRNVGDILIAEGLAVPFVCGTYSCPRMPRPWCG